MYPTQRSTKPAFPTTNASTKPQQVADKQRQRFTTINGLVLERAYISMKPTAWETLTEMSRVQGRSHSQILESLVQIAAHAAVSAPDKSRE